MSSPSPLVLVYDITVAGFELVLPLSGGTISSVNWGDGTTTTDGSKNHTYTNAGTYTVSVLGTGVTEMNYNNYGTGVEYLTGCTSFGEIGLTNLTGAFLGASNLTTVPTSLPVTSTITNMNAMFCNFAGPSIFNQDISGWDVSNVTDMGYMFFNCNEFNQDISGWNTTNVHYMNYMFNENSAFNQNIGGWDTSNVINMNGMFASASAFNQDISSWDVSKVTNMSYMFQSCEQFNQDISSWDISSVTTMTNMFLSSTAFSKQAPYILDNILNSWSSLTVQSGVIFDAPQAYYSSTGQAGYDALVAKGWTINAQLYTPPPLVLVYDITVAGFELILPLQNGTITSINWGDGNTTTDGSKNHTYTNSGTYTVSVLGTGVTQFSYSLITGTGVEYLTGCNSFGEIGLTDLTGAFLGASNFFLIIIIYI